MPLTGLTRVFTEDTLTSMYPSGEAFLEQFDEAVQTSVEAGFVLPEGARELRRRARDAATFVADAAG